LRQSAFSDKAFKYPAFKSVARDVKDDARQRMTLSQSFFNKGKYPALLCSCTLLDWWAVVICV
jgi:hypothetical protein